VPADLEKLAYESALRALGKQERLVEELRARTGLVLAAASVAASLLGRGGIDGAEPGGLALLGILGFVVSVGAAVRVLLPRADTRFSVRGAPFFGALADSEGSAELLWRAALDLDRVWMGNDEAIRAMAREFSIAAMALAVEVGALALLVGGTLI
jgi:hypothetical protein